ncbi:TRAP transporter large permease [Ornithinimicrobium avium]|uniref:TRAP transporter large permease n=1 Tax=Ornithinimicrobium avium TaxID=2283195 RepID=A0A345NNQ7_9MICO|nr:TRAP transporter large permease [Ornithinimicrobium avium]AXH96665.1 TRAP transporter large permease [Ornithinimicrobium avium]
MIILAVTSIVVLILLGVAVAFAFGVGAFFAMMGVGDASLVPSVAYRTIDSFPLLAIPFFLLAGTIMKDGGVSTRLVNFVAAFTGRLKGGMGVTLAGASAIFGAITGSSVATVSAMGSIMTPEMEKRGYPRRYVAGMVSVAGLLGILIPPSIPMIVYGIAANVSISKMFLGGIIPGLLLFVMISATNLVWARNQPGLRDRDMPLDRDEPDGQVPSSRVSPGLRRAVRMFVAAVPALLMPVVILGGIYSGYFTPTESGAVACLYGLLVGLLVYRGMRVKTIHTTLLDGMLSTAPILVIIALGGAFARALTMSGIPTSLALWIDEVGLPIWALIIVLNLFMLVVGMLVEENTAIIVLAPLLMPIVTAAGIDPVQFGVIMVLNLGIGLATPPMAPNIFVAAGACGVPAHQMVGWTLRFLLFGALPVLVVTNVVPWISMWHM